MEDAPHGPSRVTRTREATPGELRAMKLGCAAFAVIIAGTVALGAGLLARGCGEAKDVLRAFRDDVKAGRAGDLPQAQADDADVRRVVAASTDVSVSGYEEVERAGVDWICVQGSLQTPQGSKDVDLLARRPDGGRWTVTGVSLSLRCRVRRGEPRFVKR